MLMMDVSMIAAVQGLFTADDVVVAERLDSSPTDSGDTRPLPEGAPVLQWSWVDADR